MTTEFNWNLVYPLSLESEGKWGLPFLYVNLTQNSPLSQKKEHLMIKQIVLRPYFISMLGMTHFVGPIYKAQRGVSDFS